METSRPGRLFLFMTAIMKKKTLFITALVSCMFNLVGCGNSDNEARYGRAHEKLQEYYRTQNDSCLNKAKATFDSIDVFNTFSQLNEALSCNVLVEDYQKCVDIIEGGDGSFFESESQRKLMAFTYRSLHYGKIGDTIMKRKCHDESIGLIKASMESNPDESTLGELYALRTIFGEEEILKRELDSLKLANLYSAEIINLFLETLKSSESTVEIKKTGF